MRRTDWLFVLALAATARAQAQAPAAIPELPAGWKSRLIEGGPDGKAQVRSQPPGWDVATSDAGLWWDPAMIGKKTFSVTLEAVLSPRAAGNGFGVFIGGRDLEPGRPAYLSFLVRSRSARCGWIST